MPAVTLLAFDPDPGILRCIRSVAVRSGYRFVPVQDASEALRRARELLPDAVVARAAGGGDLVGALREAGDAVPVLLTALPEQEEDLEAVREQGGVGVLFFPFSEAELAARLGGLLRWAGRPRDQGVLTVGPVSVDLERGELLRPQAQPLTGSELRLLRDLLCPPRRILAGGREPGGSDRTVDVHVAALRSKLGPAGRRIAALRGGGYRFML